MKLTIANIQQVVAEYYGITIERLIGPSREFQYLHPRHIAYYLCHTLTNLSDTGIGKHFSGRDHSTIANGCKKLKAKLPINSNLRHDIAKLSTKIRQPGNTQQTINTRLIKKIREMKYKQDIIRQKSGEIEKLILEAEIIIESTGAK